jgi:hypothetical protein
MSLKDDLATLAADIVKDVKSTTEKVPFDQKLSAFNALRAYYALEEKLNKGRDDDDPDEPTMEDLQETINGSRNGRTSSRIRSS